jgi:DNA-binding NarL/FixJ family response regulator
MIQDTAGAIEPKVECIDLNDRERRILQLLHKGFISKQIAEEMCLSVKTVDTYRERLLEKTRTRNVAQLISFAFANGLLK